MITKKIYLGPLIYQVVRLQRQNKTMLQLLPCCVAVAPRRLISKTDYIYN